MPPEKALCLAKLLLMPAHPLHPPHHVSSTEVTKFTPPFISLAPRRHCSTPLPQHVLRQRADDCRCACVGLARPLGVAAQQHRRIVAAARGNDVHRHASVKQQRFMRTAQIMEAQLRKAELAHRLGEKLREAVRVAEGRERESSRDCCRLLILQRGRRSGSVIVLSSFSRFVIGPNPSGGRSGAFAIPQDRQNRVKRCGALAHQLD